MLFLPLVSFSFAASPKRVGRVSRARHVSSKKGEIIVSRERADFLSRDPIPLSFTSRSLKRSLHLTSSTYSDLSSEASLAKEGGDWSSIVSGYNSNMRMG